jgi:asparagine synthase (glutamine-hydrolysing)
LATFHWPFSIEIEHSNRALSMCGIAGHIRHNLESPRESVTAMIARMTHRGPDHHAVADIDGVALFGHARLAIIDLSPLANQPMAIADGRYTITYNGEVYNFAELREELGRLGYHFKSQSDTEVVLAAFAQWGTASFDRFNGMFALAIWDRSDRELTLARDRFGKKPLYYTALGGGFSFASELSGLEADPDIRARLTVSIAGLNQYLAMGYVLSPLTIYRDVFKLEPATYLTYRNGGIVGKSRFWDYRAAFDWPNRASEDQIAEDMFVLFDRAVKRRLVGDVPVGSFLSGGVDSSGIVALAKRHLSYQLHTFTIGFNTPSYDESADARRVASHLSTIHHERLLTEQDIRGLIDSAIDAYDEPLSDTSLVPTCALARLARQYVTVALSGDGADEIFGGYATYRADRLKRRLDVMPRWLLHVIAARLARAPVPRTKVGLGFKAGQFAKGMALDYQAAHYAWRELYSEAERIEVIGVAHLEEIRESDPLRMFRRHYQDASGLDRLSQHLYVDAKTWLVDDVLVKVDRASMASSLEVRCPFLDRDFAEYVAGIPAYLKIHRGEQKYILKKMLARHLPVGTLAKKKTGFNAPINAWLGNASENEFRYFNRYVSNRKQLTAGLEISTEVINALGTPLRPDQ